jgi:hypothetical protein
MLRLMIAITCISLVGGLSAHAFPKLPVNDPEPKKDAASAGEKPPEGDIDVHKTAERIADNAQKAGDRLKEKDPGEDTRKIQQDIIKDIDALIKKAKQPPPPPMSSDMNPMMPPPKSDMPPPMGGGPQPKSPMGGGSGQQPKSPMAGGASNSPMPKGGSSGTSGRKPRDRKPRGDSPMGDPMANAGPGGKDPMPARPEPKDGPMGGDKTGQGGDKFGKASPKRENDKLADLYRDVWGHLPERMRQEMDLYYREQFMPRYTELLKRYYAALAEQKKKGSEDR